MRLVHRLPVAALLMFVAVQFTVAAGLALAQSGPPPVPGDDAAGAISNSGGGAWSGAFEQWRGSADPRAGTRGVRQTAGTESRAGSNHPEETTGCDCRDPTGREAGWR